MSTCPQHGTYWGSCQSCANAQRDADEQAYCQRLRDQLAAKDAEIAALKLELTHVTQTSLSPECALDAKLREDKLRERLRLAEAVAEATELAAQRWFGDGPGDAHCRAKVYEALEAWRGSGCLRPCERCTWLRLRLGRAQAAHLDELDR